MVLRVFSSTVCAYHEAGDKVWPGFPSPSTGVKEAVGKLLGWISAAPFLSAFFQLVHVYSRREIQSAFILLGVFVNQAISVLLKEIIHEPRPPASQEVLSSPSYGMPSSHSQCISFASACYICTCIRRPGEGFQLAGQVLQGFLLVMLSCFVAWSRVYLGYHTVPQVIAGLFTGALVAALWTALLQRGAHLYPVLEEWWLARLFGLRDSSHLQNPLRFEADAIRRSRGKNKRS